MPEFCPGYAREPFRTLAASYPGARAYPSADFRVEWGPVFHRGRLDGSARVLLIGQDPGQHENVLRRILAGEAGRRVQGFLARLGITRSYVMINALLYSVYGSRGARYVSRPGVRDYRNRWIEALLAPGEVEAVVTFGAMAKASWTAYAKLHAVPAGLAVASLTHPTAPESAGGTKAEQREATRELLRQWSAALQVLHPAISGKDEPATPLVPYGDAFADADKAAIPAADLPAGVPGWMYEDDGWARRVGATLLDKRRNITITVPEGVIPPSPP
jgi:uracil-DNA glycosylase